MRMKNAMLHGAMALAIATSAAPPASATTLIRASLDELAKANTTVVVGEVLDIHSYWNEDSSFIFTDVRVAVADVVKGQLGERELTFTVMGGTVGDLTTLIVGGPELVPGRPYVLVLNQEDLPGGKRATTVRDLCQGIYDIVLTKNGALKAISQANSHPLVPDAQGYLDAPGGVEGLPFDAMLQSIRATALSQTASLEK